MNGRESTVNYVSADLILNKGWTLDDASHAWCCGFLNVLLDVMDD